jgi:hypothetical protein
MTVNRGTYCGYKYVAGTDKARVETDIGDVNVCAALKHTMMDIVKQMCE